MITNAQPWDNLKFDLTGITEVRNKFFRNADEYLQLLCTLCQFR